MILFLSLDVVSNFFSYRLSYLYFSEKYLIRKKRKPKGAMIGIATENRITIKNITSM